MIVETGTVVVNKEQGTVVRVRRGDACASCGAGCACATDGQVQMMEVVAQNLIGAEPGDRVEVALTTGTLLSLSALTYLFPLAFLFLGAFVGPPIARAANWNLDADLAAALVGFVFLIVGFIVLALIMRRQRPGGKISPVIVRILSPGESAANHVTR